MFKKIFFFITKPAGLMQNRLRYSTYVNQPLWREKEKFYNVGPLSKSLKAASPLAMAALLA